MHMRSVLTRLFSGVSLLALGLLVSPEAGAQQNAQPSRYDAHTLWNPMFYPSMGNEFRSASGAPGPKYWQNSADYTIDATLDTASKTITGTVLITYKNNSPEALPFLWMQMDQNIYRKDSRG